MKSRAANLYRWTLLGGVAHHGRDRRRKREIQSAVKPSTFGDVHHIAVQLLANIFVNIFYIDFEENRGHLFPISR
jgi:hypothetical protein